MAPRRATLHRLFVALLAMVVLVGFQDTLVRSLRCARANATHHANSTPSGSEHLARAHAGGQVSATSDGESRISASIPGDESSHLDGHSHDCPTPLAAAFVDAATVESRASWSRTTISNRAPPEPTRNDLDPIERPPRSERGLLSA